jgi:hypothetical protein
MSEYQFYEFVALDRTLTDDDVHALRKISSRAEISATRFFNEYNYGDFKGDPVEFVRRWFDVHVYFANWGTYRLILGFPCDKAVAGRYAPYFAGDAMIAKAGRVTMLFEGNEDGPEYVPVDDNWIARLTPLRAEIMVGDLRPLYLGWLSEICDGGPAKKTEPPVPPGLGALSRAQKSMVEFLRIPRELVKAAAAASPPLPKPLSPADNAARVHAWLAGLTPARLREVISDVVSSDQVLAVRARLLAEIAAASGEALPQPAPGQRTAQQLLAALD